MSNIDISLSESTPMNQMMNRAKADRSEKMLDEHVNKTVCAFENDKNVDLNENALNELRSEPPRPTQPSATASLGWRGLTLNFRLR